MKSKSSISKQFDRILLPTFISTKNAKLARKNYQKCFGLACFHRRRAAAKYHKIMVKQVFQKKKSYYIAIAILGKYLYQIETQQSEEMKIYITRAR